MGNIDPSIFYLPRRGSGRICRKVYRTLVWDKALAEVLLKMSELTNESFCPGISCEIRPG